MPALNLNKAHQDDDVNETLEKVKLRSRSVLRKAGFHKFAKPIIKIPDKKVRQRLQLQRRQDHSIDRDIQRNQSAENDLF